MLRAEEVPEKRGKLIRVLEDALALSEELNDAVTGHLIECALDQARSDIFRPDGPELAPE